MHFLRQHTKRYKKPIGGFEETAIHDLKAYAWPGNVRELNHTIERAVLMAKSDSIQTDDLGLQKGAAPAASIDEMSLEEVEKYLVQKAMTRP